MADVTSTSNGNTPQPPLVPSPAPNGNGETNGNGSISSIPGFGTAPVAASSPAGSSSTPIPAEAARPLGGMNDDQKRDVVRNLSPAKIANIRKTLVDMQAAGMTKENSTRFLQMSNLVDLYEKSRMLNDEKRHSDAQPQSADENTAAASAAPAAAAPPPSNSAHIAMNSQQIAQVRSQAAAYQLLSKNQPVPSYLQQAAAGTPPPGMTGVPSPSSNDLEQRVTERTVDAVVSENVNKAHGKGNGAEMPIASGSGSEGEKEKVVTPPSGPAYAMEFDQSSAIYPYNAYTHPNAFAYRKFDEEMANPLNKLQRTLVPTTMPKNLDPYLLLQERNRFIETRKAWRIKELEEMDATYGNGQSGAKEIPGVVQDEKKPGTNLGIKARIELMQLRLAEKQRLLREDVVRAMHGATQIPADRSQFRRFRTHTLRDARATESAERRQRTEREQRGKQRHLAYINSICDHGQNIINAGVGSSRGAGADKMRRLGRSMLKIHADTEKEEQRRIERLAKERLKALKNDDEDAYLALLGEAKDSRIGHLLKQTDQYLETLAAAVVAQQNDDVHRGQAEMELPFEQEEGPASEAMFGARRQDGEEEGAERKEGKVDYYAVSHRIQEKVTGQASMLTGGTLKDYQVKGLQWMISLYNNRLNGILADEMGLGKTIQTISLITYLIERKRQPGPFIVIVPLSTLTNWTLEFERWAPTVKTVILKGSPLARKDQYARIRSGDFQVCMTTYEYIIKERPLLSKIKWVHMIIDEGHRMKNVKSKLSQTLNEYYSTRYRLILTGTPLQNNLPELWALLNFVLPKIFNSVKSFDEWFNAPFANTGGEKMEMNEEEALLVVKRLHKVLRPFLLRRLKKDVESELPDKVEKVIYTKMSALQWKLYESVQKYKTLPVDMTVGKPRKAPSLQNALMQLRKICNHPYVFPEVDEDFAAPNNAIDEQIMRTSGKFELLDRILPKLFKTGHKVLIFFQMTEIMTLIADFFSHRGWQFCRLDGSTKADDRQVLLSTFNDPNSPYQVFILSTRAGGLGLNLQSADTVIIYDTDWNPHADLQAQDRAHRIGQKKEVRVLRLISSNTVEELVLARAQAKLEIDGKVIQAGKFDDVTTGAEYEALLAKAFETNNDQDNEETNELDDDELNELLARGDHELEIFAKMDQEREALRRERFEGEGHEGALPPPLMAENELPPFYRIDIGDHLASQVVNDEDQGRGRRARAEVKYSDGLTDDQWLTAMDASDDDVDAAVERKQQSGDRRRDRKRMNEMLAQAEAEGKPITSIKIKRDESVGESGTPPPAAKAVKKRGRPSKSATPSVMSEDGPVKRRKVEGGNGSDDRSSMLKLYTDVNALTSEVGEMLNTYFVDPVSKTDYPDYFQIIKRPICMKQIKRRMDKDPTYSLATLKSDMHLLWDNARTYNQEGSWVFDAADTMQEEFDKMYDDIVAAAAANNASASGNAGPSGPTAGEGSQVPSGSSTPMFKAGAGGGIGKIKLNFGTKLKEQSQAPAQSVGTASLTGEDSGQDDDEDDDY